MYSFDIKTKTRKTVVCVDDIPSDIYSRTSKFICIPTEMLDSIDETDIIQTLKDARKYAEAIDLHYHHFDDGYFKHANGSDLPYLTKTIKRAEELRGTDIPDQLHIDIEAIIDDCKEQIQTIQRGEIHEQKRINEEKTKKLKAQEVGYIYLIKSTLGFKIGKSKNLSQRLNQFSIKMPFEHECIFSAKFRSYHLVEKILHSHFSSKHINGEWFSLTEEDIKFIKEYSDGRVE
jgi:hypothetical protein